VNIRVGNVPVAGTADCGEDRRRGERDSPKSMRRLMKRLERALVSARVVTQSAFHAFSREGYSEFVHNQADWVEDMSKETLVLRM
jgi:hypothetical protein